MLSLFTALLLASPAFATEFYLLKAEKTEQPRKQPTFDTTLPRVRMLFEITENQGGNVKARFFVQTNLALGRCTDLGGDRWSCPVTSQLYALPELELRNNVFVYAEGKQIGMLSLTLNDDSVVLDRGCTLMPASVQNGFGLVCDRPAAP